MKFNLLVTVFSRMANTGFATISAVIVVWIYGDIGLGVFALLRTLPSVLLVFTEFGFSHAYSYLINNKKYSSVSTLSSGLYSAVIVSFFQVIIWCVFSDYINSSFKLSLSSYSLYMAAILAPLLVLEIHVINVLRAIGEVRQANLVLMSVEFLITCFLMVIYLNGIETLDYLCYTLLVSNLIVVVLSFLYLCYLGVLSFPKYNAVIFQESFKFGVKSQVGNAFQLLNYRLDHLIIGFMVGPKILGVYVVATKAAEFFRFFSLSIVFVLEPLIAKSDFQNAIKAVKKYYAPMFLINVFFVLVGILIGPFFISLLFDKLAENALTPFYILMFGLLFVGSNGLVGAFNLGQGKPELNTIVIGITLLVTVIFNIILVPVYGVNGAASASTLAYITSAVVFFSLFVRESNKGKDLTKENHI